MSRRGPRSPRWWSTTTASLAGAGAWPSTPKIPGTRHTTVPRNSSESGRARPTPHSSSTGTIAWAGASSAHPARCPGSRTGRRTKKAGRPRPTGESHAAMSGRGTGASAALAGALDLVAGLGGGTIEGYPEDAGSVPAGFLFHGALSTYEKLGFVRDHKIGKHRWVVTRVVEPRS